MALAAVLVLTACSTHDDNPADSWRQTLPESIRGLSGIEKFQTAVDYTDASNWLSLPATTDKAVDLFYLYPTAYTSPDLSAEAIASIDDKGMRLKATTNLSNNGPAFSDYCNVFAPFYRQVDVSYANM